MKDRELVSYFPLSAGRKKQKTKKQKLKMKSYFKEITKRNEKMYSKIATTFNNYREDCGG